MRRDAATVRMVLNAQMGKDGRRWTARTCTSATSSWGILPAAAPLSISTLTIAGMAMAFAREEAARGVSFIGEGGSSLGEWHEAINLCAARRLPAVFCVENNQTALSTPVREQSAVRVFADKAVGYGIPGITIDGTDPDAIAAAFTWAAERARAADGPALIELVSMRMCGHAHHDDMLYLGKEPRPRGTTRRSRTRATRTASSTSSGRRSDPIATYAARLEAEASSAAGDLDDEGGGRSARRAGGAGGHRRALAGPEARGGACFAGRAPRGALEPLEPRRPPSTSTPAPGVEPGRRSTATARRSSKRSRWASATRCAPTARVRLRRGRRRPYGNAFLLLRPLLEEFGDRIINSPLAEGARARRLRRRGAGRPAADRRDAVQRLRRDRLQPAGQQRREDPVPLGRLGADGRAHAVGRPAPRRAVPLAEHRAVVLPHAGPEDRRPVDAAGRARADGRGRRRSGSRCSTTSTSRSIAIRASSRRCPTSPAPLPIGKAALRRAGDDLAIISYGAYVHVAMRVAETLAADGIEASVLDLRTLAPLDASRCCRRAPLQPRADRPRGLADRRHRREPRRDHSGRGVRMARRAGADHRRARHAGAVAASRVAGNTMDAHRVAHLGREEGEHGARAPRLFHAHFTELRSLLATTIHCR